LKVSIFMQFLDGIIASSIASLRLMFALNIWERIIKSLKIHWLYFNWNVRKIF
jgi:hypothetical protein